MHQRFVDVWKSAGREFDGDHEVLPATVAGAPDTANRELGRDAKNRR